MIIRSINQERTPIELWTTETFRSMLAKLDNQTCQNNEFVEHNKWGMVEIGPMDEQDYNFFWGCMKIYEEYGIDYFAYYIDLKKGLYGNFSNGIIEWFDDKYLPHSEDRLVELVNVMRFFEIDYYDNISFIEFEEALAQYRVLEKKTQDRRNEENRMKKEKTISTKVGNYFNFSNFDADVFKRYLDSFTTKQDRRIVTLDKAIAEAKTAPANTYIVIFYKNGKACYAGKTLRLLSYIEEKSKKHNADSVFYQVADDNYVDDLLISIMIFYDLSLSNVIPRKSNRKYATIQQACYAYRYADSVSKKEVLSAIKNNHIRLYEIDAEKNLVDKIELERVIRSSLCH